MTEHEALLAMVAPEPELVWAGYDDGVIQVTTESLRAWQDWHDRQIEARQVAADAVLAAILST